MISNMIQRQRTVSKVLVTISLLFMTSLHHRIVHNVRAARLSIVHKCAFTDGYQSFDMISYDDNRSASLDGYTKRNTVLMKRSV